MPRYLKECKAILFPPSKKRCWCRLPPYLLSGVSSNITIARNEIQESSTQVVYLVLIAWVMTLALYSEAVKNKWSPPTTFSFCSSIHELSTLLHIAVFWKITPSFLFHFFSYFRHALLHIFWKSIQPGKLEGYFYLHMPDRTVFFSSYISIVGMLKGLMKQCLFCHCVIGSLPSSHHWEDFAHRQAIRSVLLEMRSLCSE